VTAEDYSQASPVTDLQQVGTLSERRTIPILLLVSREQCSYCRLLKREILQPSQLGGDLKDRVILQEILIDPGQHLKDFQGQPRLATEFASDYGINLTPTLLFLDSQGRELTDPLVGVNTLEMYGFYLDTAVAQAQKALHGQTPKTIDGQ
jgi:thioredoxin-related protein